MEDSPTNHASNRLGEADRLTETRRDQSTDRRLGEDNQETRRLGESYTIREAAEILGTTVDAIRGRIRRGTLDSMKVDGQVYVLLDPASREQHADKASSSSAYEAGEEGRLTDNQAQLVGELKDQIEWLRREVERKDTIIMSLTQRIPELEAPLESQESREARAEATDEEAEPRSATEEQQEPPPQRSWLYRFFFGPG